MVIELAYWRKTYGIRDELVEIVTRSPYLISTESGDVVFNCRPQIISDITERFSAALTNTHDSIWSNSIWSNIQTRDITLENLRKLFAFESFLSDELDEDEQDYLLGISDEEVLALNAWRQDPFEYMLIIEIVNSY